MFNCYQGCTKFVFMITSNVVHIITNKVSTVWKYLDNFCAWRFVVAKLPVKVEPAYSSYPLLLSICLAHHELNFIFGIVGCRSRAQPRRRASIHQNQRDLKLRLVNQLAYHAAKSQIVHSARLLSTYSLYTFI